MTVPGESPMRRDDKSRPTPGQVRAMLAAWFGRTYHHDIEHEVPEFVERMKAVYAAAEFVAARSSTRESIPAYYVAVHTGGEPYDDFDFPIADNIGFKASPSGAWMRAHDVIKALERTPSATLPPEANQIATMIGLLRVAKCPACDGSGGIPHQIHEDQWALEQCQWCDERSQLVGATDDTAQKP